MLGADETSENARAALEVYFREDLSWEEVEEYLDTAKESGLEGFSLIVDPRADVEGASRYIGFRHQYIPEFSARWDDGFRAQMNSEEALDAAYYEAQEKMAEVVDKLSVNDRVAYAKLATYDTLVIGKEYYEQVIQKSEELAGTSDQGEGSQWFPASRFESLQTAIEGYQRGDAGSEPESSDLPGGNEQEVTDPSISFSRENRRSSPDDPFYAANRRIKEQDRSLWDKGTRILKGKFGPGGLLPTGKDGASVHELNIKRGSEQEAVELDLGHILGAFNKAVKKGYGVSSMKLADNIKEALDQGLRTDAIMQGVIPPDVKAAIYAMRQKIDSLSKQYLDALGRQINDLVAVAKRLPEGGEQDAALAQAAEKGELYKIIKENIGAYVHRSYRAFDDEKWKQKVPVRVLNNARKFIARKLRDADENLSEDEANRKASIQINTMLTKGTAYDSMPEFLIREPLLGAKDLSILVEKKNIAKPIRELLGEYKDPRINFAEGRQPRCPN